ncbi:MAG: hypothetical protein GY755_25220 [Chloroflexi bacterium]|nr:hypothetical protein [Chloroflexota bacterium]
MFEFAVAEPNIEPNYAAFTPQIVISEPAIRPSSSSSAPKKTSVSKWAKHKIVPSAISDFTVVEQDKIDKFTENILRTLTDLGVESVRDKLAISLLVEMEMQTANISNNIQNRIKILAEIAEEDDITINSDSETDLWRFLKRLSFIKQPKLFLLENGNFRIVWKGGLDEQIGLQFLGKGQIQFVMFSKPTHSNQVSRIRGRSDFDGIARHMEASATSDLVYA